MLFIIMEYGKLKNRTEVRQADEAGEFIQNIFRYSHADNRATEAQGNEGI